MTAPVVTPPTCTERGYTDSVCAVCGQTVRDAFTDAVGHVYGAPESVAPTCTEQGYQRSVCTVCGDEQRSDFVEPAGHRYEQTAVVAPTCTERGYTRHTCVVCGDFYDDTYTAAAGHDYRQTGVIQPTCTERGYTQYVCAVCGAKTTDQYTQPLGHRYGAAQQTAATCTGYGFTRSVCERCGYAADSDWIEPLGHALEAVSVTDPTCLSEGYTQERCTRCGWGGRGNVTEALGHTYAGGVCTRCGTGDRRCGITYYNQRDAVWADLQFGVGNMKNNGCVPTAVAMALSTRGIAADPVAVATWLYDNTDEFNKSFTGASGSGIRLAAEAFGAQVIKIRSYDGLAWHLQNGAAVVAAEGPGRFCSSGSHAIVLVGFDGTSAGCYDPYLESRNGWYALSQIWSQRSGRSVDLRSDGVVMYAIY